MSYEYVKLAVKKNSEPISVDDPDCQIIDLDPTSSSVTVSNLDQQSLYYFTIFFKDSRGYTAESDSVSVTTDANYEYEFSYTGHEEVLEITKSGTYSLETWGAQGGDASDGYNTARGGYGSYAYGETFLNQGDKLYVNVGGQNGYGGGGNKLNSLKSIAKTTDMSNVKDYKSPNDQITDSTINGLSQYYGTDNILICYRRNDTVVKGNRILTFDGNNGAGYQEGRIGYPECYSYIPVNHCKVLAFSFDGKLTNLVQTGFDRWEIDTCYINGSNLTPNTGQAAWLSTYGTSWHHYEVIFNTPVDVDYIRIFGEDGDWQFKNFKLVLVDMQ